jgi:hypothetical protein
LRARSRERAYRSQGFVVHYGELRRQHLQTKTRMGGYTCVFLIRDDGKKLIKPPTPDGRNDAELGKMRAD